MILIPELKPTLDVQSKAFHALTYNTNSDVTILATFCWRTIFICFSDSMNIPCL